MAHIRRFWAVCGGRANQLSSTSPMEDLQAQLALNAGDSFSGDLQFGLAILQFDQELAAEPSRIATPEIDKATRLRGDGPGWPVWLAVSSAGWMTGT